MFETSAKNSERLMEAVCEREDCLQAMKRVKSNKGSPGMDGMTVEELPGHLKEYWPAIGNSC
jgi:RNA-directed DNA polymerase